MIDEHGKRHATPEAGIPPHMLEAPTSNAQREAFAKLKGAEAPEKKASAAKKPSAKKASKRAKEAHTEAPVWPDEQ